MGQYPELTLVEKAAVDTGFDRLPERSDDWTRFRSTQHRGQVTVCLQGEGQPLLIFLPRSAFSVALLDLPGVDLASLTMPLPWPAPEPLVVLMAADVSAVRTAFGLLHSLFVLAVPDGQAAPLGQDTDPLRSIGAAIRELPETTEVTREILARIGQERFRLGLIEYWEGRCAVTGLSILPLLRASHIQPWTDCTSARQRLDVFNGLLLAPHLDAAFDGGWIGFSEQGGILISPALDAENAARLGIDPQSSLTRLDPCHRPYLRYHASHVLRPQPGEPGGPRQIGPGPAADHRMGTAP